MRKFKVGDLVVYDNPIQKKHSANGSKYVVTKILPLQSGDYSSDWVIVHGAEYCINIKHVSGTNVQSGPEEGDGYYNVVFRLANSDTIKQRLGVK